MEIYLKKHALYDEDLKLSRTYLVLDTSTNQIAAYFTLRTGLITVSRGIFKGFDAYTGIELANFAVNDSYREVHEVLPRFGSYVFYQFILPLSMEITKYIGAAYLYIFALPDDKLMAHYETMGFNHTSKEEFMKTKLLKLLAVMTISITALFALGITASAAQAGDFTITLTEGGDPVVETDYTYADGVLTINTSTALTIKNANPSTPTTDRIEVADGVSANITLAGVNIDVSSQSDTAAFKIADNSTGNVTITLADRTTNTLKSGDNCAGLQKNGEYSETLGKLTITGTCSLTAPGGAGIGGGISASTITAIGGERGAGIGGGYSGSGSNITITISGGTVTATGGNSGAGIGGGSDGRGSYITISDGTVTATGGKYGAGIGGGYKGSGSNIEISGGKVTATGGDYGAGIGGGSGGSGSYITISGGTVTATGGDYGAGIGGGDYGSGSYITISGGTVTATGGAGIGDGYGGSGSYITISGGSVKASSISCTPTDGTANATPVYLLELTSATSSFKIDGKDFPINHGSDGKVYVYLPEGEHTVISDENSTTNKYAKKADNKLEAIGTAFTITGTGLVYGTDYTYPASTGVLTILSVKDITIKNTTPSTSTTNRIEVAGGVSANITLAGVNIDVSSQSYTAAFKIADNSAGNVTITLADGTTNTLKSGNYCAGLQKNGAGEGIGMLTICGTGSLSAQGGTDAGAGIGGGYDGSGSNITISGGVVIANGGGGAYGGAGIGGGSYGSGSNITISGGTVTATGGGYGAGIGGGFRGSGSNIKISGGTVTATGGSSGAGIGGGDSGSGSNITISGGTVTATGGVGIGDGYGGSGSYITISGGSVKASSIGCTPTDGTANATPVYLLELDVDGTSAVTINGKAYPTKHFDENKVYIYLPAKTAQAPNEVTVGNETTKYCYINAKWLTVVEAPEADDYTEFTYDGTEKTYTLAESDYYTITGNEQTNAGTYTVTVVLNDKDNTVWNDGTTDDKTFTFTIAKATVTVTAKSYTIKVGEALPTYAYDVTGLVNDETLPIDVTISCTSDGRTAGAFDIVVSGVADSDNYTFSYVNGTLTVSGAQQSGSTDTEKTEEILTIKNVKYKVIGKKKLEIAGTTKNSKTYTLYATVDYKGETYKVISIGEKAFANRKITKITLPSTLTEIKKSAFSGCDNLKSIKIPKSVTKIGSKAFYKCTSLKNVTLSASMKEIGDSAFYKCSKIKSITIPKNVTKIGKNAFYGCSKLSKVTFSGKKIKSIGSSAFKKCVKSGKFYVPSSKEKAYKKLLKGKIEKKAKIVKK